MIHTDGEDNMKCNVNGCNKEAVWHFRNQWPTCDEHVDESEKILQDNVDTTIQREKYGN
jgi:hypothetical protein